MTPTQLAKIKGEFEEKFTYKFCDKHGNRWTEDNAGNVWDWIESKLEEVEKEAGVSVLTEVAIAVAEVARKGGEPELSWRCGKCEQEEMMAKGIAIPCPIPEHSIRCPLRTKVVS